MKRRPARAETPRSSRSNDDFTNHQGAGLRLMKDRNISFPARPPCRPESHHPGRMALRPWLMRGGPIRFGCHDARRRAALESHGMRSRGRLRLELLRSIRAIVVAPSWTVIVSRPVIVVRRTVIGWGRGVVTRPTAVRRRAWTVSTWTVSS
jgi:hypothetical protein